MGLHIKQQRIVLLCCCIISFAFALIPQQSTRQQILQQSQHQGGAHWQIHRTIQHFQSNVMPSLSNTVPSDFASTTADVVRVLQSWAKDYAGKDEWKSLLNKRSLRHEIEESIVALHHLREWRKSRVSTATISSSFIAVDVCCGKGVFSTLLSYLVPQCSLCYAGLSRIILLDKNEEINWDHIQAANANHTLEKRPFLELWSGTNLHEHDIMMERLLLASVSTASSISTMAEVTKEDDASSTPLAITGIHLCKTLSPALVGIVNALGKETAPYLCLAPCCLPGTRHQQLAIPLYEGPLQRQARMAVAKAKKETQKEKQRTFACFVCQGNHHVKSCPERINYATEAEWDQVVSAGMLKRKVPCWKCGKVGHRQSDCTVDPSSIPISMGQQVVETIQQHDQPRMLWDFASVVTATPQNQQPFEAYCDALSKLVQQTSTVRVMDSGLTSSPSAAHNAVEQENNWNQNRKSLFITAVR